MSIRDQEAKLIDRIPVRNVLLSCFDKSGLEELVPALLEASPGVRFMSTGGTYKKVKGILGAQADGHLIEVAEYTGFPEMEGGLVKTLHPMVHAGLLGERNNPAHQSYIAENGGVYIDAVVVNLYPFEEVIARDDTTFETARGNVDIGGPTMLRAAAKNFMSVAVLCSPSNYAAFIEHVRENGGCTTFEHRLALMPGVFSHTAKYDSAIAIYMFDNALDPAAVKGLYTFEGD